MGPENNSYDIKELAEKFARGTISKEERAYFEQWYASFEDAEVILTEGRYESAEALQNSIFKKVLSEIEEQCAREVKVRRLKFIYKLSAAATILLFLSFGAWLFVHNKYSKQQNTQNQYQDIAPGGDKAILTLADGRKIVLSGAKNGTLAQQSSTEINKTSDGKIVYTTGQSNTSAEKQNSATIYNTISTPAGGKYTLVLADGTIATLDAASSIKYPVAFNGHERRVEITGQVYFEVVHNSRKPFRVVAGGQTVEDLGTRFNINAYSDEPSIETTLVEGSIKISSQNQSVVLKPGQQAAVSGNEIRLIPDADLDEATAWKNGYFKFNDEELRSVMRKISRWYDVDVQYDNNLINNITFFGEVSRSKNISTVLKVMEATGKVHFLVSGRRVTVMP